MYGREEEWNLMLDMLLRFSPPGWLVGTSGDPYEILSKYELPVAVVRVIMRTPEGQLSWVIEASRAKFPAYPDPWDCAVGEVVKMRMDAIVKQVDRLNVQIAEHAAESTTQS